MVTWFRGVVQSAQDTAKGVLIARSVGRGVRELVDIPQMLQRGLKSIPLGDDLMLCVQDGHLVVAIATQAKSEPTAEAGETVLFSNAVTTVRLKQDGSIVHQGALGSKVEIAPTGFITVHGLKVDVIGDTVANILAPKVGLGMDGLAGTPADQVLTCQTAQCLLLAVPHVGGSPSVFAAPIPTPAVGP